MGGKTAAVPSAVNFLIHVISKGITSATVATPPRQPDPRQIRFLKARNTRELRIQHLAQERPISLRNVMPFPRPSALRTGR